ncbi:Dehydrogenase multihelical [Penicillium longicatenatum]|uniref:Dehydrogenase multihelical n=1 Tax=Penicillium longicatenatum TaxID=1561947 RepID=UPI002546E8EC|nr:Dehydrogenase multihelical [Penicillium longicatenatum]KAJ5649475.1 Dehydrogenase multihelical [Penicillium longicatenatum]
MRAITVGIISIGDMGLGMARLLKAHGYRVVTVAEGRSEHTLVRIKAAEIEALPSDQELVVQADYILSIVPPRNAQLTAERIAGAVKQPDTVTKREALEEVNDRPSRSPLYYLELNATPARLAEEMAVLFETDADAATSIGPSAKCHFLDGGIIGGPPAQNADGKWKKPSVVLSGAVDLPSTWAALADVLNLKLVSERVGAASTLKLSFAALTKGLTALSILSFSTAQREDLLPELLEHLQQYSPHTAALAQSGVIGMSPKAYRWVDEMRGIGEAFDREGGWNGVGSSVYGGFAEIYRTVAEDTLLGHERVEARQRGKTVEDAATVIARRQHQSKVGEDHDIGPMS